MVNQKQIPLAHPECRILIVGGGVGGLCLANLLEIAGLDYQVFERAAEFKPLGSAISLGPPVFTFLQQLGIFEDLLKVGKPYKDLSVHSLDLETQEMKYRGTYDSRVDMQERFGFPTLMLARPDLMEALMRRIPRSKILMKKRVLSMQQSEFGVMIRVADGSQYHGDIVVGSDGAYSPVRQSMFEDILKRKILSTNDQSPLQYNIDCCVGVTQPLDPTVFTEMGKEKSEFQVTLVKQQNVSIWYMPLSRNRMGWMVNEQISEDKKSILNTLTSRSTTKEANNFKQSGWSSEAAMEMCNRFRDYSTPYGDITLGTFMDLTPPELISKVMLEEKYFETWTDGRVCLIGDACHKVLPFGAVGATNAMLDALQLANLLYDLRSNSDEDIAKLLKTYHKLRKDHGQQAVEASSAASKLFHTKGWVADASRHAVLNLLPDWVLRKSMDTRSMHRPQVEYLPFLTDAETGSAKMAEQKPSVRYLMQLEALATRRSNSLR